MLIFAPALVAAAAADIVKVPMTIYAEAGVS